MTKTQRRNNMVLGCAVALALFLCAIPVQWFTIHPGKGNYQNDIAGFLFAQDYGMSITATGLNGSITFLLKLPIWLLLGISAFGILMLILNIVQATALPRFVPILCLAIPGLSYLMPLYSSSFDVSFGPGPTMALLATALGLILTFKKTQPVDQPQEPVA